MLSLYYCCSYLHHYYRKMILNDRTKVDFWINVLIIYHHLPTFFWGFTNLFLADHWSHGHGASLKTPQVLCSLNLSGNLVDEKSASAWKITLCSLAGGEPGGSFLCFPLLKQPQIIKAYIACFTSQFWVETSAFFYSFFYVPFQDLCFVHVLLTNSGAHCRRHSEHTGRSGITCHFYLHHIWKQTQWMISLVSPDFLLEGLVNQPNTT